MSVRKGLIAAALSSASLNLYVTFYALTILDCGNANNLLNLSDCAAGTYTDVVGGLAIVVLFNLYLMIYPIIRARSKTTR